MVETNGAPHKHLETKNERRCCNFKKGINVISKIPIPINISENNSTPKSKINNQFKRLKFKVQTNK